MFSWNYVTNMVQLDPILIDHWLSKNSQVYFFIFVSASSGRNRCLCQKKRIVCEGCCLERRLQLFVNRILNKSVWFLHERVVILLVATRVLNIIWPTETPRAENVLLCHSVCEPFTTIQWTRPDLERGLTRWAEVALYKEHRYVNRIRHDFQKCFAEWVNPTNVPNGLIHRVVRYRNVVWQAMEREPTVHLKVGAAYAVFIFPLGLRGKWNFTLSKELRFIK